jgi:hypothetical protein
VLLGCAQDALFEAMYDAIGAGGYLGGYGVPVDNVYAPYS